MELLRELDETDERLHDNVIHDANSVLGLIALREGNTVSAKEHLLAAGKTPGSPHLDSFGPNMRLAKELLEHGEQETVLDYFRLCGNFWKREELDEWISEVEAGRIPDFGPNMDY